jgi:hypothetical protein
MIAAIVLAVVTETAHGTWDITSRRNEPVLETRWHSDDQQHSEENAHGIDPNALGISAALDSRGQVGAFTIHRDAGDIACDGWFGNGQAAGTFTFVPNATFFTALEKRGYVFNGIADELSFATLDVSNDYINAIERLGYKTDVRGLRELRALDVTPGYISEMRAAGVDVEDAHRLGEMKAVGVTPKYVSDLANAGYPHLTSREYIELKAIGVDGAYIRSLASHGLKDLTIRRILELKAIGVN